MVDHVATTTLGLIKAEIMKLRGSLVVWLSVAVPGLVLLLGLLALLNDATQAEMFMIGTASLWAYAMLPLGTMALTVVLAQIEHGARAWDPLLSLPGTRRRIFIIKLTAAALVLGLWTLTLGIGVTILATIFDVRVPPELLSMLPGGSYEAILARMWGASLFMLVVQYGLALYFRSFVPPLLFGVGGIIFAVGATSTKWGIYFPWLLPTNQLASEHARADFALWLGLGGAVVCAAILQWLMARREW
ncbi:ABC transporter permease [Sphingomicrobium sediminis]|uniref:ABC transporter permease n=1 Tax=Sphingomicrobium sediminis TaxID=2950949 RepID=A0A9X2EFA2_9SPHN|nr:ABC transporter permease [Sphingomicrobium sediminis]MCM8556863.1 ABC transporter permease [Sphingomicrobium sediminis]